MSREEDLAEFDAGITEDDVVVSADSGPLDEERGPKLHSQTASPDHMQPGATPGWEPPEEWSSPLPQPMKWNDPRAEFSDGMLETVLPDDVDDPRAATVDEMLEVMDALGIDDPREDAREPGDGCALCGGTDVAYGLCRRHFLTVSTTVAVPDGHICADCGEPLDRKGVLAGHDLGWVDGHAYLHTGCAADLAGVSR